MEVERILDPPVTSNRTQLDRALSYRSSFPAEQFVKIVCCHHDLFVLLSISTCLTEHVCASITIGSSARTTFEILRSEIDRPRFRLPDELRRSEHYKIFFNDITNIEEGYQNFKGFEGGVEAGSGECRS